ncbi:hypothetical protein [Ostreiculturibacter nitratireducens]|uniref:hypothetical protein n=1 Tax=Ostreiculturibacter nitratireducens TaxID=3075226 RepID=UPI0031B5718E
MSRIVTPTVQFGSSRFLQAHADLFSSEGTPPRAVTVVQSSGDPVRAARLGALAAPEGYPVRIRGRKNVRTVDEELRVITGEAEANLSNTSDASCDPKAAEGDRAPSQDWRRTAGETNKDRSK